MKKILLSAACAVLSIVAIASKPVTVNEKVLQAFNETFKNVEDVKWLDYATYYEVNFSQNKIRTRVSYDTDGNILQTVRYYYEDQLPLNIVSRLKKSFPTKKVFGVTELGKENELSYHIVLEDDKTWMIVKSDPYANFTVDKKFRKA